MSASSFWRERLLRSVTVISWAASCALSCATAVGCIPSHRMVHDGDTYFERCYAADFDARLSEAKKEACWQAWLAFYTRHQPAHRVDYALRRIEALQNGEPLPELPGSALTEVAEATWPASATDGSIPPANAPLAVPLLSTTSTMEGDGGAVLNGCQQYCREYESACDARCHEGTLTCWHGCEAERKICLRGCY